MVARILEPSVRLAHNRSGANLVSGVASALLAAREAELGLFEVDEAALPEVARRLAASRGLARKPVSRPARPLRRARAAGGALAEPRCRSCRPKPRWSSTGTTRRSATSRPNGPDRTVFGLDDPRHASAELQHAADSKWCVRCGTPYVYAAAYIGHLGDYRCPACGHARPVLDVARARSSCTASTASRSTL